VQTLKRNRGEKYIVKTLCGLVYSYLLGEVVVVITLSNKICHRHTTGQSPNLEGSILHFFLAPPFFLKDFFAGLALGLAVFLRGALFALAGLAFLAGGAAAAAAAGAFLLAAGLAFLAAGLRLPEAERALLGMAGTVEGDLR